MAAGLPESVLLPSDPGVVRFYKRIERVAKLVSLYVYRPPSHRPLCMLHMKPNYSDIY
jgi:hypothetical protein